MGDAPIEAAPLVDLVEDGSIEVEIAATLLYSACHYSYRQITQRVQSMSAAQREEIIDLGLRNRGAHDEPLRSYHCGQQFKFDILMDVGGFRDMHRHRRCTQIEQGFTSMHGSDMPPEIATAGLDSRYQQAMKRALSMHDQLASSPMAVAAPSPKPFISQSYAPRLLDTFPTAMSPMPCTRRSRRGIRRWPGISGSPM